MLLIILLFMIAHSAVWPFFSPKQIFWIKIHRGNERVPLKFPAYFLVTF